MVTKRTAQWYSPTAKAISCRWQIIVRAWLSSETKFARVQKVKSNALLRREQERGCPGSHQTAYQDISPWVTAIDARQMIFATSAKHRSFRNLFLLNRFLKSLSIGRVFPWYHCRILGFFPCIRSEQSGFSRVCFIPLISIVGFFPYVQKYCFVTLPNDRSSPCSLRIAHATILRTARGKY